MKSILSLFLTLLILAMLDLQAPSSVSAQPLKDSEKELTGQLIVIWGDGAPESGEAPAIKYQLVADDGHFYDLRLDGSLQEQSGNFQALNRRQVRVQISPVLSIDESGSIPSYDVLGFEPVSLPDALGSAVLKNIAGSQPWVSVLCKFNDVPAEPKNQPYFQDMFSSSFPGLDHYWREVSYNTATVYGSLAAGWYTLPHPRSYYIYNNQLDFDRAAEDCTAVADAAIYYPAYDGINLMFNADLDGYAWGGAYWLTRDGVSRLWNMTWEPPWGYQDITVIAHEMGHGFGLPHSSGNYGRVYDNSWDVMSDTWTYCSRSTNAIYGCLGQETIAYHKDILGWIPADKKYTIPYIPSDATSLDIPSSQSFLLAQVPVFGSLSDFYTVEARNQISYDIKLPGQAIIIHRVLTSRREPAHVVDSDNNGNNGDEGAQWKVGETFQDPSSHVSVAILAILDGKYQVRLSNGSQTVTLWLESLAQTASPFLDVTTFYWAHRYIDRLYNAGVTNGCAAGPLLYCSENSTTRAEMAVFLLKAKNGASYVPLSVPSTFSDTSGHWAANWIEALRVAGISSGYPDGTYRPDNIVTRAEMAVFLLKAKNGASYLPPDATPTFSDTSGSWAVKWIEALKATGITSGYPDGTYKPDNTVTRAEMAAFLVKAFNLP